MEEIKKLHDINIEWGCITNLMDRIVDMDCKMDGGWPELIDMVADAVSEEGENKDPASAFFNLYQFLFRLHYRIKADMSGPKAFNKITEGSGPDGDTFIISNYDYTMFKWAKANGFGMSIDNNCITIIKDKLTDRQRRAFERRAK